MPFKDKSKARKYKRNYMKDYREKQKARLQRAKEELAKSKPDIPTLRELLGVEVHPIDLIGKEPKPKKSAKKRK